MFLCMFMFVSVGLKPPSNFAGRFKAALLFWFFCDFRYGVLLFIIILVIYK